MPSCVSSWPLSLSLQDWLGTIKTETAMDGPVEHVGGEMYSQISCHSLAPGTAEQIDKKKRKEEGAIKGWLGPLYSAPVQTSSPFPWMAEAAPALSCFLAHAMHPP